MKALKIMLILYSLFNMPLYAVEIPASIHGVPTMPMTTLPHGRVHLAVSVDWEGREIDRVNIEAMKALRRKLPDVPFTHFINAAYYTKERADHNQLASMMREAIAPEDETGLHIHAWRSLVEAAGVSYRSHPTFWGDRSPRSDFQDTGHDVEIAAYTVSELKAMTSESKRILKEAGFPLSSSFRAGGWMAAPNVLEAIRAEGFTIDSSATDARWHNELEGRPLRKRIRQLWPGNVSEANPWIISTAAGDILEMPDTGALADYVTAKEMEEHLRAALARAAAGGDVFIHIGFHQETAARFAPRVQEALERLQKENAPILYETLEQSAAAARRILDIGASKSSR